MTTIGSESADNSSGEKTKDTKNESGEQMEFKDAWMFRPCEIYEDEYRECKCIQQRFHQYFIFGEKTDCTQWKTDMNNCLLWRKHKSAKAYEALVESERKRRYDRLRGHYQNDIWERRTHPPENWNAPLPQWAAERLENTYLEQRKQLLEEQNVRLSESSLCIIL